MNRDSVWLDLGCGHALLPDWILGQEQLLARARCVIGLDYDQGSLRKNSQIRELVAGDINCLPFRSAAFNLVTANMVVEHVQEPTRVLTEIARVLEQGGYFIFHTPNKRFYMTYAASLIPDWIKRKLVKVSEGREEADIFPTHYRMNDLDTIRRVAAGCGFRIRTCESLNSSSAGNIIIFGPFVVLPLLIQRVLRAEALRKYRSNFIVVLQREGGGADSSELSRR